MEAEDLFCSLCLDFFVPPIRITRCGHSFCDGCLTGMTALTWPCMECRTDQNQRPIELTRNFGLERTVEKFKEGRKNMCTTHSLQKRLCEYYFGCFGLISSK